MRRFWQPSAAAGDGQAGAPDRRAWLRKGMLAALALAAGTAGGFAAAREVVIGIEDSLEPDFFVWTMGPTLEHLRKSFPQDAFRTRVLAVPALNQAIEQGSLDFFMANAGVYAYQASAGRARDLASRQSRHSTSPSESTSAVIIVRADRQDLQSIADLKGRAVAVRQEADSLPWLIIQGEIHRAGFNEEKFWRAVKQTGFEYPDVMDHVASGESDAGILPACELEEQSGIRQAAAEFRVIGEQAGGPLKCRRSAPAYSGIVFAATAHADPGIVKRVAAALLQEPPSLDGTAWGIGQGHGRMLELYRTLRVGPYAYLRDLNFGLIWEKLRFWILLLLAGLAFWGVQTVRVRRLVRLRTEELRQSMLERERIARRESESRQRLLQLERAGIVSELSGLVAHELRQPLAAIMNFAGGLLMYLKKQGLDDPVVSRAAGTIVSEASRASQIVEKVRGYARHVRTERVVMPLQAVVEDGVRAFRQTMASEGASVSLEAAGSPRVSVDPLEMQLVILNLLKNAAEAASGGEKRVEIRIAREGGQAIASIRDHGPAMSDEAFRALSMPLSSAKTGGLGLGLSLARAIVERHDGHMEFERSGAGLTVRVLLPAVQEKEGR